MAGREVVPDRDASLGLIFRLNGLWSRVDETCISGNYDKWNNYLDRIFSNLSYKELVDVVKKKDKVEKINMVGEETEIYKFLNRDIMENKWKFLITSPKKINKVGVKLKDLYRVRWYFAIMKKEIWLRQLMMKRKIYMKETSYDPSNSIFGSG
jgi:hypothetical protein